MTRKPHKPRWWEPVPYKWVVQDIETKIPHHLRTIEQAKRNLAANERKKKPTTGCVTHNEDMIREHLQFIGDRFKRWEKWFSDNGDTHRWKQVPGAVQAVRINWKDKLPGPMDKWHDLIPVFGLDAAGPHSSPSSPSSETKAGNHRPTRPDVLDRRVTKPSSSSHALATTKRLLEDLEHDYFGDFKANKNRSLQDTSRQAPPRAGREQSAQHTSSSTTRAKPAAKRGRSTSPGTNAKEDHGRYSEFRAEAHKKPRLSTQQAPPGYQDFILMPISAAQRPTKAVLKRPRSTSDASSAQGDDNVFGDCKVENTSTLSRVNMPQSYQAFTTPAPKRHFVKYTPGKPVTQRTRDTPVTISPTVRRSKIPRVLFKQNSLRTPSNEPSSNESSSPARDEFYDSYYEIAQEMDDFPEDISWLENQGNSPHTNDALEDFNLAPAHSVDGEETTAPGDSKGEDTGDLNPQDGTDGDFDYFGSSDSDTWRDIDRHIDNEAAEQNVIETEVVVLDDTSGSDSEYDPDDGDSGGSAFPSSSESQAGASLATKASETPPIGRTRLQSRRLSSSRSTNPDRFKLTMDLITEYKDKLRKRPPIGAAKKPGSGWFPNWPLKHAFTDDYKRRSSRALESGQFVPLPLIMCDYEVPDLDKSSLEHVIREHINHKRAWRGLPQTRDPDMFIGHRTFSHQCHVPPCKLWFHYCGELISDNQSRECEGCHKIKRSKARNGGIVPLRCLKHCIKPCFTGCQALTPLERIVYQWMAANNFASFSEIPAARKGRLQDLDREVLRTPLVTYIVEARRVTIQDFEPQTVPCLVPLSTHDLNELLASSGNTDAMTKRDPSSNSSASLAKPSSRNQSDNARLKSDEETQTRDSCHIQEANRVSTWASPSRHEDIDEREHDNRVRKVSTEYSIRDSERFSQAKKDRHIQECAEVQRQSLQLFYQSSDGQMAVAYNEAFTGFRFGKSGMICSLCKTRYGQYHFRTNVLATGGKIVDSATVFLKHVLRHSMFEVSVRCEELLAMLDRYPNFATYLSSNVYGVEVDHLREILERHELPEENFISKFVFTKKPTQLQQSMMGRKAT